MLMLVRENDLTPAMVTRIESQTHKRRFAHTNRPDPRGALDAKFSVQSCLARALVSSPALLLADEPTASLDSEAGQRVARAMSDVGRQLGCAVLISTHDERIFHFADRRLHIEDGVIAERSIRGP